MGLVNKTLKKKKAMVTWTNKHKKKQASSGVSPRMREEWITDAFAAAFLLCLLMKEHWVIWRVIQDLLWSREPQGAWFTTSWKRCKTLKVYLQLSFSLSACWHVQNYEELGLLLWFYLFAVVPCAIFWHFMDHWGSSGHPLRNSGLERLGGKFVLHVSLEFLDITGKPWGEKIVDFGFIAKKSCLIATTKFFLGTELDKSEVVGQWAHHAHRGEHRVLLPSRQRLCSQHVQANLSNKSSRADLSVLPQSPRGGAQGCSIGEVALSLLFFFLQENGFTKCSKRVGEIVLLSGMHLFLWFPEHLVATVSCYPHTSHGDVSPWTT